MKNGLRIVYEDEEVLCVYKEAGLLTISKTGLDKNNLYHFVRERANKKNEKIFIVHRLDKDTSGLVIFAKSFKVKEELQSYFEKREVKRYYEALIKEKVELKKVYRLKQYLFYDEKSGLTLLRDKKQGKESITILKASNYVNSHTAFDIEILTGRQNQIRVALKSQHLTLIGDRKYAHDKAERMMLNAYYLAFPKSCSLVNREFKVDCLWLKTVESNNS